MISEDKLKNELVAKERKLKKIENLTAGIETLKEDIKALRRSLEIIGHPVSASNESNNSVSSEKLKRGKGPAEAEKLLREIGTPLHVENIVIKLHERGINVQKASLIGTLSRKVKKRDVFVRGNRPNTYGLAEWENEN